MLTPMFNVVPTNSRIVRSACLLALLCGNLFSLSVIAESASEAVEETVEHSRQKFQRAVKELRSGAGPRYQSLRQELTDYPLAMYLDALVIEGNLHYGKPENVTAFLQAAGKSPIAMRTLRSFVRHKMEDRRWGAVVEVTEGLTLSTELICHRACAR